MSRAGEAAPRDAPAAARPLHADRIDRWAAFSARLALAVTAVGALGWLLDVPLLYRLLPERPAMEPMTIALSAMLCVAALLTRHDAEAPADPLGAAGSALLWLSVAAGGAVLISYGWRFDDADLHRSSPQTAATVMLLASCGLLRKHRGDSGDGWAPFGGALALLVTLAALSGHIFAVIPLFGISPLIGMSIPTSIVLSLIGLALLARHRRHRFARLLFSDAISGAFLRRLLAAVVLTPFALAALLRIGEWAGLYDLRHSAAVLLLLTAVLLAALTWAIARQLARMEANRRDALQAGADARAALFAEREANRLKDDFMAMVSHEMRTPLAAIQLHAQLLTQRPARAADSAAAILRNVDAQSRIVGDLLDSARLHAGRLSIRPAPLDVAALAADTVAERRGLRDRGPQITLQAPDGRVPVHADALRLRQILDQLLDNAERHTPADGRIDVTVRRPAPDRVTLIVEDTGCGIGPQLMPRLFEPFTQSADIEHRGTAGLGLGLYLVRRLAEAHGGSASASSGGGGRGTRVRVELPSHAAA